MRYMQNILSQEGSKHVKGNNSQHAAFFLENMHDFFFFFFPLVDTTSSLWSILSIVKGIWQIYWLKETSKWASDLTVVNFLPKWT